MRILMRDQRVGTVPLFRNSSTDIGDQVSFRVVD